MDNLILLSDVTRVTPIQQARVGNPGYDEQTGRWFVYAKLESGWGWVRVLRFKTPAAEILPREIVKTQLSLAEWFRRRQPYL